MEADLRNHVTSMQVTINVNIFGIALMLVQALYLATPPKESHLKCYGKCTNKGKLIIFQSHYHWQIKQVIICNIFIHNSNNGYYPKKR